MKKSLYSLILSDEVVKRIDATAEQMGTNRSNLVNQIIADYVAYITPEMRIKHIFERIFTILTPANLIPYTESSDKMISIKTSLEMKYKPTIRYSIQLCEITDDSIGKLKVFYRTHSEELIYNIHSYLSELIHLEKKYNLNKIVYDISEGKFIRNFMIPEGKQYSQEEIARGISDYVKNFDYMMKKYLCGKYSENSSLEYDYKIYISKSILI